MKKLIAILMALSMILSLAACGGGSDNFEKELSRGTIIGDVYSNEFLGVSYIKPSDWDYLTDEEMQDAFNVGADLGNIDIDEVLSESGSFYDIMAKSESGENVIIGFENLEAIFGRDVTVEEYVENLELSLENGEIDYSFGAIENDVLGGEDCYSVTVSSVIYGIANYQKYYMIKNNSILGFIILTAQSENALSDIKECFVELGNNVDIPVINDEEEIKLSRGKIDGDVYYNEFSDINFEKPYDWYFASDEEIAAGVGISSDYFDNINIEEALANGETVYDMMAVSSDETKNVIVMFSDLSATGEIGMSEKEYIEALKNNLENLGGTEFNYESGETSTRLVGGNIYHVLNLILNGNVYQNSYIRIEDNILIAITTTADSEVGLANIETMFS